MSDARVRLWHEAELANERDENARLRAENARLRAVVDAWGHMDGTEACYTDEECSREEVIEAREQFREALAALDAAPDDDGGVR